MLFTRERKVTHDVKTVASTDRPPRYDSNHHFGHEANQALNLENMKTSQARRVNLERIITFVFVAILTANPLISSGTESPARVLGRWSVAGQQYAANIAGTSCMFQSLIELIDSIGAKCIPHLWTVKGDTNGTVCLGPVIRDVGKVKAWDAIPSARIKNL